MPAISKPVKSFSMFQPLSNLGCHLQKKLQHHLQNILEPLLDVQGTFFLSKYLPKLAISGRKKKIIPWQFPSRTKRHFVRVAKNCVASRKLEPPASKNIPGISVFFWKKWHGTTKYDVKNMRTTGRQRKTLDLTTCEKIS